MRSACLLLGLALGLAACSKEPAPAPRSDVPGPTVPADLPPLPPIPMDPAAGRSGQDSLTWIFDNMGRDGRARLMYSAQASDEMALNLQCVPGSGQVSALVVRMEHEGRNAGPWPFTLASGDERITLPGSVEGDSELYVTATLPLSAPVLARFKEAHQLSVGDPGQSMTEANAVSDGERAAIDSFFRACSP